MVNMSEGQQNISSQGKRKSMYKATYQRKRRFIYNLETGLKGFICTCNYNEKHCIREAYNILHEYTDTQKRNDSKEENSENEDNIEAALAKEAKELSNCNSQKMFQAVDTGATNCVFIKTTVPDPVALATRIMEDIKNKKKQKTRFLLRMLPIETTCKAYLKSMEEAFKPLAEKHFSSEGKTFSIIFRSRCNKSVLRDEVIESFAALIQAANPLNRADLSNPQLAVLVEIIKGFCCIGVAPLYTELKKYNLLELASPSPKEKSDTGTECSAKEEDIDSKKDEVTEETSGACESDI